MVCIGLTADIISEKIKVVFVDLQFYIERPWSVWWPVLLSARCHSSPVSPAYTYSSSHHIWGPGFPPNFPEILSRYILVQCTPTAAHWAWYPPTTFSSLFDFFYFLPWTGGKARIVRSGMPTASESVTCQLLTSDSKAVFLVKLAILFLNFCIFSCKSLLTWDWTWRGAVK